MEAGSDSLVVNEIFYSIQGESTFAGLPCVFVRLTACHLRCRWCDTDYAFTEGRRMHLPEIVETVAAYPCDLVEVTGGEPLLQPGVHALMATLADLGKTVLLETSGALPIETVDPRVVKIMDLKCPGSGEAQANRYENLEHLGPRDQIKFVIADRGDYLWARQTIERHGLVGRWPLLFSPVHGELEPVTLAGWVLEDHLPVRLQLQLHKYVWSPGTRGV
jgi:7-carboxy-7-deazaguanine synthase